MKALWLPISRQPNKKSDIKSKDFHTTHIIHLLVKIDKSWYNISNKGVLILPNGGIFIYMANGVRTGSFAAQDPGAQEAVQAAIARRQGGQQPVPQLSQTGQQAPTVTPPVPQGAPQGIPQGAQAAPTPPSEAEIIEKALSQRLSSISKVEEAQAIPPKPPKQSPMQAPVGGGSGQ